MTYIPERFACLLTIWNSQKFSYSFLGWSSVKFCFAQENRELYFLIIQRISRIIILKFDVINTCYEVISALVSTLHERSM